MDLSRPWALIRSPIDTEVLLVLGGTTRPLTGREVARLVRTGSQPAVNAVLRRLADEGLVRAEEAGNAFLYTLNREHLGAPAVELLLGIRTELERRLRAEIAEWGIAPTHVSIFGSAARGDGDTRSDIDIFVVRPAGVAEADPGWRQQLERLSDHVHAWTGNHAAISEVSAADVRRLRRERAPIVDELRRDAITLTGPPPTELLERRSDEAGRPHPALRSHASTDSPRERAEVVGGRGVGGWRRGDSGLPKRRRGARGPLWNRGR